MWDLNDKVWGVLKIKFWIYIIFGDDILWIVLILNEGVWWLWIYGW